MKGRKLFLLMLIVFLLIVVYYFSALTKQWWPFSDIPKNELGTFGDSWGMLTSIFSVLAFMGVSYSLLLQVDAFKRSEKEAIKQDYLSLKKNFESNLFQMLSLFQTIISEIRITKHKVKNNDNPVRNGRSSFITIYESAFARHNGDFKEKKYDNISAVYNDLFNLFNGTAKEAQFNLGHYFRFLYNIFRYIDESDVSEEDKVEYSKIVRAQISNYELLLLFYNIMHTEGMRFVKYVEQYQLFDNLPINELISPIHALLLNPKAYGENASFDREKLMQYFKDNHLKKL